MREGLAQAAPRPFSIQPRVPVEQPEVGHERRRAPDPSRRRAASRRKAARWSPTSRGGRSEGGGVARRPAKALRRRREHAAADRARCAACDRVAPLGTHRRGGAAPKLAQQRMQRSSRRGRLRGAAATFRPGACRARPDGAPATARGVGGVEAAHEDAERRAYAVPLIIRRAAPMTDRGRRRRCGGGARSASGAGSDSSVDADASSWRGDLVTAVDLASQLAARISAERPALQRRADPQHGRVAVAIAGSSRRPCRSAADRRNSAGGRRGSACSGLPARRPCGQSRPPSRTIHSVGRPSWCRVVTTQREPGRPAPTASRSVGAGVTDTVSKLSTSTVRGAVAVPPRPASRPHGPGPDRRRRRPRRAPARSGRHGRPRCRLDIVEARHGDDRSPNPLGELPEHDFAQDASFPRLRGPAPSRYATAGLQQRAPSRRARSASMPTSIVTPGPGRGWRVGRRRRDV
jgi:hypothetical protein